MSFRSIDHLLDAGREMSLWRAVLEDDCRDRGVAQTDSMERMEGLWRAMGQSVDDYRADRRSPSGLSGGLGRRWPQRPTLCVDHFCNPSSLRL